ncbi:transaldolase [Desulfococcaceae bacterium HSG9]|nr:transaldolase [Desulfococcaceae bacterium HSG9]
MKSIEELRIKIFADGADIASMKQAHKEGIVKGFTTNPTLMKKAGVTDYEAFGKAVLDEITDFSVSFEVLSDDFADMEREARKISSWGPNVCVKIPITNTKGESSIPLVKKLSSDGLSLNITAILTIKQVRDVSDVLSHEAKSIVSIFAGRIADTGRDPIPYMQEAVSILKTNPNAEILWASPREFLNILQAEECGCHIITVTNDHFKKFNLIGKDLNEFSLDTVKMFYRDAQSAGLAII